MKPQHVDVLENVDIMLLKKILNSHAMTAKEAFFLEGGLLPLRFVIYKRRLLYMDTIMKEMKIIS